MFCMIYKTITPAVAYGKDEIEYFVFINYTNVFFLLKLRLMIDNMVRQLIDYEFF